MSKKAVIPSRVGSFELLTTFPLEFFPEIRVAKWVSTRTGLKVVWADTEGPLIDGGVQVCTEIWNDSGCPHTLEHLVFMGSEKYPFKGLLDVLANRMFGNGTNAWTATICTNFTSSSASEEGFLQLLPVYMDHILFPTLTKSAFCTEVYHMNGKGEDSGTVLSEMQGSATDSDTLMQLDLQRTLYSKDNANRSETGGMLKALRKLDVETVRKYHDQLYVPQNMTITVIGGAISPLKLLRVLQEQVESSLIDHALDEGEMGPKGWKRPFVETRTADNPPVIEEDEIHIVSYPSKDESVGQVTVSWIGPRSRDQLTSAALTVLESYLSDSAISPLSKLFVEVPDPSCTGIGFGQSSDDPQIITASLGSVPSAKLDEFGETFKNALEDISSKDLDISRMKNIIRLATLALLESAEISPKSYLSETIQSDALYGANDGSQLEDAFKDMSNLRQLLDWSSSDWVKLLKKYFVNAPSLTIIGKPSAKLVDKLAAEDKARIAGNVARLGPKVLADLDADVVAAAKINAKPIPPSLIKQFQIPSVATSIRWTEIDTARTYGGKRGVLQQKINSDLSSRLPLDIHFAHVDSNFITIGISLFADKTITYALRNVLPLYNSAFFTLPVKRQQDGKTLSYEEVVKNLDIETVHHSLEAGELRESITLSITVEKSGYAAGIRWLNDLLFGTVFSIDRLKICLSQQLQDLPALKQDGAALASAGLSDLIYQRNSSGSVFNLLALSENLPQLMKTLRDKPQIVVNQLSDLHHGLTDPRAMKISVVGDVLSLKKPVSTWLDEFEPIPYFASKDRVPVIHDGAVLNPWRQVAGKVMIYQLSSIESTYGAFSAPGPNWEDPDLPALIIAQAILNAMEGALWVAVRGGGLAYGASLGHDADTGHVTYELFKSPDVYAAWKATRALFEDILSGKTAITELQVEAAKSIVAYRAASVEETRSQAAVATFYNEVLMDRSKNYNREVLARTDDVNLNAVLRVIRKYIPPLFNSKTSIGSISSGTVKASELVSEFKAEGYAVTLVPFG